MVQCWWIVRKWFYIIYLVINGWNNRTLMNILSCRQFWPFGLLSQLLRVSHAAGWLTLLVSRLSPCSSDRHWPMMSQWSKAVSTPESVIRVGAWYNTMYCASSTFLRYRSTWGWYTPGHPARRLCSHLCFWPFPAPYRLNGQITLLDLCSNLKTEQTSGDET